MTAVRCPSCPDHPVLPAVGQVNHSRCVRCQSAPLTLPHPTDHLCAVCRSECPDCGAPAGPGKGGLCGACQGRCRVCGGAVPERAQPAAQEAGGRPRYFPATGARRVCDRCAEARPGGEQLVLRALPPAVLRACGGSAPGRAVQVIREQLGQVPAGRLVERIERRWWSMWAHRPLQRPAGEDGTGGYGPDDVAVSLVAPSRCAGGCEDGWRPGNADVPCPVCQPVTPRPAVAGPPSEAGRAAAAAVRAAVQAGKGRRVRGEYVPAAGSVQERVSRLVAESRRPKQRPDITPELEKADPVWAAAVKRARQERGERE